MYGWRAKIGRISPSPETVGAEEWRRSMPDGVCLVETRTLIHDVTVEGLSETVKQVERAALELASAEVDVILQAGTAIAFFRLWARSGIKPAYPWSYRHKEHDLAHGCGQRAAGAKNSASCDCNLVPGRH